MMRKFKAAAEQQRQRNLADPTRLLRAQRRPCFFHRMTAKIMGRKT